MSARYLPSAGQFHVMGGSIWSTPMIPSWDSGYPSPETLKEEIQWLTEAFVETLLAKVPESGIEGIYFKGSAQKAWASPLDYVPELSDVDIHVLFSGDGAYERHWGTASRALDIQALVETKYFSKVKQPVHFPRPQLFILNELMQQEDYVSSPSSTVTVLYGKPYPQSDFKDSERIKRIECKHLLSDEQFLTTLPHLVIDRPSKYLWEALRRLAWRISPIAPRVLHLHGFPTEQVWSANRTTLVARLREQCEEQLARDYLKFYISGWKYFLSDSSDSDAARASVIAAARAIKRGGQIARSYLDKEAGQD